MKPVRILSIVTVACALLTQVGCASLFTGTRQLVNVTSAPAGATVSIDGMQVGTTPWSGEVKKSSNKILIVSKDGFQSQTVPMMTSIEPWFWGNIICGGFLGSTNDFASGGMYQYAPNVFSTTLVPLH